MQGDPEQVLNRCSKVLDNGVETELTFDLRSHVQTAI